MITLINTAIIKNQEILLIKKENLWMLPGRESRKGESDLECLTREFKEEFSNMKIKVTNFYREIMVLVTDTNQPLKVRAYFAEVESEYKEINLSADVEKVVFFPYSRVRNLQLSSPTREIIGMLKANCYL